MLYDKRWDAKVSVKVNPLSLEALIAWLEKKPAEKRYCYDDAGRCLAAQYNKSLGREYDVQWIGREPTPDSSFDYCLEWIAIEKPRTFGAALERARDLQAQR
jgi:hypothetical protein